MKKCIVIVFNTPISSCNNYDELMKWVNWVNTKITLPFKMYFQRQLLTKGPYVKTTDVLIRIANSMSKKLEIPEDEKKMLLKNLDDIYINLIRNYNTMLQKELPF